MVITKEWLESGMKGGIGIKSKQCKFLGLPYPPPKGWKYLVIGNTISDIDAQKFLYLRDKKNLNYFVPGENIKSEKPEFMKPKEKQSNTVVLTEEMVKKGFNKKFSKAQCMVLGIPTQRNKAYKKSLIGQEIDKSVYKEFLSLRTKIGKKSYIKKMQELYKTILNQNYDYEIPFFKLLDLVEKEGKLKFFIAQIPYSEFLKSAYWRSIATFLKDKAGKCELCGAKTGLVVHHKTYLHHGDEIHHPKDLIVLCRNCHKKEHEKHPELTFTNKIKEWDERNKVQPVHNLTFDDMRLCPIQPRA